MLILIEKGWESSFLNWEAWEWEPEGRVRFSWERKAPELRPKQEQRPGRHCCKEGTGDIRGAEG